MISYEELSQVFDMENPLTLEYFELVDKHTDEPKYFHRHHVLPASMFPEFEHRNWNKVRLSYKDHYLSHKILSKICIQEDHKRKMMRAYITMSNVKETGQYATPEEYEMLRKLNSDSMRGEKNHNYGRNFSEETRKKISVAMSGENSHRFGKPLSDITKKRLSASRTGIKYSEKAIQSYRNANAGEKNPFFGRTHSEETLEQMREWHRNNTKLYYFQHTVDGELIKRWDSRKELEAAGYDPKRIYLACRTQKRLYDGYVWSSIAKSKVKEDTDV